MKKDEGSIVHKAETMQGLMVTQLCWNVTWKQFLQRWLVPHAGPLIIYLTVFVSFYLTSPPPTSHVCYYVLIFFSCVAIWHEMTVVNFLCPCWSYWLNKLVLILLKVKFIVDLHFVFGYFQRIRTDEWISGLHLVLWIRNTQPLCTQSMTSLPQLSLMNQFWMHLQLTDHHQQQQQVQHKPLSLHCAAPGASSQERWKRSSQCKRRRRPRIQNLQKNQTSPTLALKESKRPSEGAVWAMPKAVSDAPESGARSMEATKKAGLLSAGRAKRLLQKRGAQSSSWWSFAAEPTLGAI